MIRRPPRSTRTDTLFPYTTLFRSAGRAIELRVFGMRQRTVQAQHDPVRRQQCALVLEAVDLGRCGVLDDIGDTIEGRYLQSEARRVGTECVRTCRSRGSP